MRLEKKYSGTIGFSIGLFTLIALTIGIRVVLGNEINIYNLATLAGFSAFTGISGFVLVNYRLKFSFLLYVTGLVIGFIVMYLDFVKDNTGWGDLIGLLSLFAWTIIGLGSGLLLQLGYYLYNKFKKN